MAKNVLFNIMCEEDQSMSATLHDVSTYEWMHFILTEGQLTAVERGDLSEAVAEYVAELKKDHDDIPEWLASVDKVVEEFWDMFDRFVKEHNYDEDSMTILVTEWAVEYDHCLAIMVCGHEPEDEE